VPLIRLKDAHATDVLAADVLDPAGGLLVAKGTQLTAHVLQQLAKRGVDRLHVVSRGDVIAEQTDEQREAIRQAVEQRFRWVPSDPFMRALKEIVLRVSIIEPTVDEPTPPGPPPDPGTRGGA
jgi:hypothetical protein